MNCKHCGRRVQRVNWYDGPGWTHERTGQTCSAKLATPDEPACAACDKPVEILPSGVMVHPDGTGHEEWRNHERLAVAQVIPERPYERTLSDGDGDLG